MLYVESSALMKRYVAEPDSNIAIGIIDAEPVLATSRLTEVEVRRNLARLLRGTNLAAQRERLLADFAAFAVVELDSAVLEDAACIAEETLCRSLDAIHLAAARRLGPATALLTFDRRQARAAQAIGLSVQGVELS